MTLTGRFIRETKNSYQVSTEIHEQIKTGVSSAIVLWQNRDSDLQIFPYNTLYLTEPYSFEDPLIEAVWQ